MLATSKPGVSSVLGLFITWKGGLKQHFAAASINETVLKQKTSIHAVRQEDN
jgi:hypothetical protein